MQHEIAESFFNDPVDPDALGIPEYRDIVQVNPAPTHTKYSGKMKILCTPLCLLSEATVY